MEPTGGTLALAPEHGAEPRISGVILATQIWLNKEARNFKGYPERRSENFDNRITNEHHSLQLLQEANGQLGFQQAEQCYVPFTEGPSIKKMI